MIKIILAEDHKIVRNGLKNLLEKEKNFQIVGEAADGTEVMDLLEKGIEADIVLTDMNMPGMDGAELTTKLRSWPQYIKVVFLTMLDHEKYVVKAFKAGANGYLLKNISSDELVFAIKHVCLYADGRYVCSELALRLLDRLIHLPEINLEKSVTDVEFSKRELEILELMAEGYTNQEIADQLFTSKRTVEGHRQSMIDKTEVRNTAALIKYAVLNGIIK
jgi:DNA-binding NarL/FixJ family response regulator